MKTLIPILLLFSIQCLAQENKMVISGKVIDARTQLPLSNATIEVKSRSLEMISSLDGTFDFRLPESAVNDSITVSHIGYKPVTKRIADMKDPEVFMMKDYVVELRMVTITSRKLNLKEIDNSMRNIRGNFYACATETTNGMYNLFLSYLEENGQEELLRQCTYEWSGFDEATSEHFKRVYTVPFKAPADKKDTSVRDYTNYPAVSISHTAAGVYCQWLTEQYNSHPGKKKFKKVKFRLPSLKEWQIAALGYDKFQSWDLLENTVEVVIPDDTVTALLKGVKTKVPVTKDILYPWWSHYNYRRKPVNFKNCYLANFKSYPMASACAWGRLPSYDGWYKMAQTSSYFPNNIGLYDMVGNVAEMIDEKGKACGGSWDDTPKESTIHSVKTYKRPDDSIGFRIFMEVLEK